MSANFADAVFYNEMDLLDDCGENKETLLLYITMSP